MSRFRAWIPLGWLMLLCAPTTAQTVEWSHVFNGPRHEDDFGSKALFSSNDELLVGGTYNFRNNTTDPGIRFARHDRSSTVVWELLIPTSESPTLMDMTLTPSGDLIAVARFIVQAPNYVGSFTMAIDAASGQLQWSDLFFEVPGTNNQPGSVCVDANSDVYVCGTAGAEGFAVKYEGASGLRLWTTFFRDANGPASALDIEVNGANQVFIAGVQWNPFRKDDLAVVRLNASNGGGFDAAYIDGGASDSDRAFCLALDRGGLPVVGGYRTLVSGHQEMWVVKLTAGLAGLWEASFGSGFPGSARTTSIAVDDLTDRVLIAGHVQGSDGYADTVVRALSPFGQPLWGDVFSGQSGEAQPTSFSLDRGPTQLGQVRSVFVGGFAQRSSRDIFVRRLSLSQGTPLWTWYQDGFVAGQDTGVIALSPIGLIGVTGEVDRNAGTHTNWWTGLLRR